METKCKFIKEIPDDGRTIKVDFGPLIEFVGSMVGPAELSRLLRTVYDDCSINLLDQFIDDRGDETHCTHRTVDGLFHLKLLADALDECEEVQTI